MRRVHPSASNGFFLKRGQPEREEMPSARATATRFCSSTYGHSRWPDALSLTLMSLRPLVTPDPHARHTSPSPQSKSELCILRVVYIQFQFIAAAFACQSEREEEADFKGILGTKPRK